MTFSGASVTSGTVSTVSPLASAGNTVTVNLTGVTDAQALTLTLLDVNDGYEHERRRRADGHSERGYERQRNGQRFRYFTDQSSVRPGGHGGKFPHSMSI